MNYTVKLVYTLYGIRYEFDVYLSGELLGRVVYKELKDKIHIDTSRGPTKLSDYWSRDLEYRMRELIRERVALYIVEKEILDVSST